MTDSPEANGQRGRRFAGLRGKPELYFKSVDGEIRQVPGSGSGKERGALSEMVHRTLERVRRSIDDRSGPPS